MSNRPITQCLTCRRRKVRCDRALPTCSVCTRGGHVCIYQSLPSSRNRASTGTPPASPAGGSRKLMVKTKRQERPLGSMEYPLTPVSWTSSVKQPTSTTIAQGTNGDGQTENGGILILDDQGQNSRFVTPLHWASVEKMSDLKSIVMSPSNSTNEPSPDVHPMPYEMHVPRLSSTSLLFCPGESNHIAPYYPETLVDCQFLLETFFQNVDPIVRIVHRPSLRLQFDAYISRLEVYGCRSDCLEKHDGHFDPLAFGIFFSAIHSMNPTVVQTRFGASKECLLQRFRNGLEVALEKQDLLTCTSIPVFQAFVLLLTCLCREDDNQRLWSLVGLAVRIAQSLGLHREPTLFPSNAMDAIQVEVRRRLWHQIFHLDFRTAVYQGLQPLITTESFDTLMPSNVDDEDLVPGQLPLPNNYDPQKFTDMTMQLVRLNGIHCMQKLLFKILSRPFAGIVSRTEADEEQEMRILVEETLEKNQISYLRNCDASIPLHRSILELANHIKWKFWIIFYYQFSQKHKSPPFMTPELRTLIYTQSLNLLDSYLRGAQARELDSFRWHFDSHSGLQATSYLLLQLSNADFQVKQDPTLLERGRQILRTMRDLHANDSSKAWALLRSKIDLICGNEIIPEKPAAQGGESSSISMEFSMEDNSFSTALPDGADWLDIDASLMMPDHEFSNMEDWLMSTTTTL